MELPPRCLMEQTRKRFGNTIGFRLVVYPTYAILDRLHPQTTAECWPAYRGG
jgi:hypothetical protein